MATPRRKFDFDIVIVGSGMVGTCLAALLAGEDALSGLKIALVDPAHRASRTIAQWTCACRHCRGRQSAS